MLIMYVKGNSNFGLVTEQFNYVLTIGVFVETVSRSRLNPATSRFYMSCGAVLLYVENNDDALARKISLVRLIKAMKRDWYM